MSVLPIDPAAFGGSGVATEWQIEPPVVTSPDAPSVGLDGVGSTGSSESFGDALTQQISNLAELQDRAADASTALANGTATDAASVVIAVEKAQLAMQLAGQIRTRAAEAVNDIFRTQI